MDVKTRKIIATLGLLDAHDDDLWTAEGLPRVDVVSEFASMTVTRQDITNAAPQFTRETLDELPELEEFGSVSVDEADEVAEPPAESGETKSQAVDPGPAEGGSVLSMNLHEVIRSEELRERAAAEMHDELTRLRKEKLRVEERLTELSKMQANFEALTSRLRLNRARENHSEQIKAIQRQSQENRRKRAAAAEKFAKAGTTPEEVAAAIGGSKSPIDKAFGAKRGFGQERPNYAPPSRK